MSHYRKKPIVIEAFRWDGTVGSADAIGRWSGTMAWETGKHPHGWLHSDRVEQLGQFALLTVHTLEGDIYAQKGDWIIKGIKGEFYPCKPDIFAATYEPVSSPEAVAPSTLTREAFARLVEEFEKAVRRDTREDGESGFDTSDRPAFELAKARLLAAFDTLTQGTP